MKDNELKKCNVCNLSLSLSSFNKNKTKKDGLCGRCVKCGKKYMESYHDKNSKSQTIIPNKKTCCMCLKSKKSAYFYKNRTHSDGLNAQCKQCYEVYRNLTKDKINKTNKIYLRNKRKNSLQFKIKERLRVRLRHAVKASLKNKENKTGSSVDGLGCTVGFFIEYLESKFTKGMNWENYGLKGWHMDHIQPLSSFNLTNKEDFSKACHYTNIQPLWWYDNLKKAQKTGECDERNG